MTKDEQISVARLAQKVDKMAEDMVAQAIANANAIGRIDGSLIDHINYTRMASAAESSRIDAIMKANAEALHQANAEANDSNVASTKQAETVANTLRDLVETTRSANAKSLSEVINPIQARLSEIEQKQYEDKGKEAISDPNMAAFMVKMEAVTTAASENKGRSGMSEKLQMLLAGLGGGLLVYVVQTLIK